MRIDIVTLFPEFINSYCSKGVLGRGIKENLLTVVAHDLRPYGIGRHNQVDDRPFGGGAGMLLKFEPIAKVITEIYQDYSELGITNYQTIALSAGGETYKQSVAKKLNQFQALILLCGRYEGFDQRIIEAFVDQELSIGNYVLSGGELASLVVLDSIARLIPGVLGKEESFQHDSFYEDDISAQYEQYTRPETIDYEGQKLSVPEILLSGNHQEVAKWRKSRIKLVN